MKHLVIEDFDLEQAGIGKFWILCWLGEIKRVDSISYTVEVWFCETSIPNNNYSAYLHPNCISNNFIKRDVNIGYLTGLLCGSLWDSQNKKIQDLYDYCNGDNLSYHRKEDSIRFVNGEHVGKILPLSSIVTPNYHSKAPLLLPPDVLEQKVYVEPSKKAGGIDLSIIIPLFEIARFFFFNSSKITNKVIRGTLSTDFELHDLPNHHDKRAKKLSGKEKITEDESKSIAKILSSPKALDCMKDIESHIKIVMNENYKSFIYTSFPFSVSTPIIIYGRRLIINQQAYFFVYEIIECNWEASFSILELDEIIKHKVSSSSDSDISQKVLYRQVYKLTDNSTFDSTNSSSNTSPPQIDIQNTRRGNFNQDIQVIYNKIDSSDNSKKSVKTIFQDGDTFSNSQDFDSQSKTPQVNSVKSDSVEEKNWIEAFNFVMNHLITQFKEYTTKDIIINNNQLDATHSYAFLDKKLIKVLIKEVVLSKDFYFYFFEFFVPKPKKRKKKEGNSEKKKEEETIFNIRTFILMAYNNKLQKLNTYNLNSILTFCAFAKFKLANIKKLALSKKGIKFVRFRHEDSKDIDKITQKYDEKMKRIKNAFLTK